MYFYGDVHPIDTILMPAFKIKIEVVDILGSGKCSMEQHVGDVYEYPEDRGKMCTSSFHILYPWILVMQSGGSFSFFENDNSVTVGCSDYTHQVVYKVTRHIVEEEWMNDYTRYNIDTDVKFEPLEDIDIPKLITASQKDWQNHSLSLVNDCIVRLGVIHGEFHWHSHDNEDEFFYVISGLLLIDIADQTHEIHPGHGFVVPRGTTHRTRAPKRTAILMVEGNTVTATGD